MTNVELYRDDDERPVASFSLRVIVVLAGILLLSTSVAFGYTLWYYSEEQQSDVNDITALQDQLLDLGAEPVVEPVEPVPGVQGEQGRQGDTGERGPQGQKGQTGATGPSGAKGVPGPKGPQGEKGEEGPRGPSGPAGPQGPQGSPGPAGQDGRSPASFTFTYGAVNYTCTDPDGDGHYECQPA